MKKRINASLIPFDCLWSILSFINSTKLFFKFRVLCKSVYNVLENDYGYQYCNVTFRVKTFMKFNEKRVVRKYVVNLKILTSSWSPTTQWKFNDERKYLVTQLDKYAPNLKVLDVLTIWVQLFHCFGKKQGFTLIDRTFYLIEPQRKELINYLKTGNTCMLVLNREDTPLDVKEIWREKHKNFIKCLAPYSSGSQISWTPPVKWILSRGKFL